MSNPRTDHEGQGDRWVGTPAVAVRGVPSHSAENPAGDGRLGLERKLLRPVFEIEPGADLAGAPRGNRTPRQQARQQPLRKVFGSLHPHGTQAMCRIAAEANRNPGGLTLVECTWN